MLTKIKMAWDYFLHHPDKTYVILQIYVLNPVFKFTETLLFFIVDKIRKCILWLKEKAHKI